MRRTEKKPVDRFFEFNSSEANEGRLAPRDSKRKTHCQLAAKPLNEQSCATLESESMTDVAIPVTAAELLSESEPTPAPAKRTLYAEDFPGVEIKPVYPGASYGRHPTLKRFVSLKPKPGSEKAAAPVAEPQKAAAPEPTAEPQPFEFTPAPELPLKPASEPQPQPTAAAAPPESTAPVAEPPKPQQPENPNFSDLTGERPAEQQQVQGFDVYKAQAEYYFDFAESQLAAYIGPEWNKQSDEEKAAVVLPLAKYLEKTQAKELSPGMLLLVAVGTYGARRVQHPNTKEKLILAWLKVRGFFQRVFARFSKQ
jgi:hypothetical protein